MSPTRLLGALAAAAWLSAPATALAEAPCGTLSLTDGHVRTGLVMAVGGEPDAARKACIERIARELADQSGMRAITVAARVTDDHRGDGSALLAAQSIVAELAVHGVPRRRISAVAPRVGPHEPPGIHITYIRRRGSRPVAKIIRAQGDVRTGPGRSSLAPTTHGAGISDRDYVKTAERSLARLALADRSQLRIDPGSLIRLGPVRVESGSARSVQIDLLAGSMATVASHYDGSSTFEIVTDHAVAGVRGTSFRVTLDGDVTRLETLGGRVALGAQGAEVWVDGGYGSRAAEGAAPEAPRALPDAPGVKGPLYGSIDGSAEVAWTPTPGAAGYRLELARDADFSVEFSRHDTRSASVPLSALALSRGDWFFRVLAVDDDGFVGSPSRIYSFRLMR